MKPSHRPSGFLSRPFQAAVRALFLLLTAGLISGCATDTLAPIRFLPTPSAAPPSDTPPSGTPQRTAGRAGLGARAGVTAHAASLLDQGKTDDAASLLDDFIRRSPGHDGLPAALLALGRIYHGQGDYPAAALRLRKLLLDYPGAGERAEAWFLLVVCFMEMQLYEEAERLAARALLEPADPSALGRIQLVRGRVQNRRGERTLALDSFLKAAALLPSGPLREEAREAGTELLRHRWPVEKLEYLAEKHPASPLTAEVIQSIVKKYEGLDDAEMAEAWQATLQKSFPEAAGVKARAASQAPIVRRALPAGRGPRLGLLLPLSGEFAPFGRRVLKAVMLAAGVFDGAEEGRAPVEIVVRDTRGEVRDAVNGLAELAADPDVLGVIGPLRSPLAQSLGREAQARGIPLVTLTKAADASGVGDWIFRNVVSADQEARALAGYAMRRLGLRRFAVLYPDDRYGMELRKSFAREVISLGGEIITVESYPSGLTDLRKQLIRMGGRPRQQPRERGQKPREPLELPYEAIFIPDDYSQVGLILPQLVFHDMVGLQALGTSSWDSPQLIATAGEYAEGAVFLDSFFPYSLRPKIREFSDSFYRSFGFAPGSLEAESFDAAALLVGALAEGVDSRAALRERLLSRRVFKGVTGSISFDPQGDARRSLTVIVVRQGLLREAPETAYLPGLEAGGTSMLAH